MQTGVRVVAFALMVGGVEHLLRIPQFRRCTAAASKAFVQDRRQ